MFTESKRICKAAVAARNISERNPDRYVHVMSKKFRCPITVFGGWSRMVYASHGWTTECVFKNGIEVEFLPRVWPGK